MVFSEHLLKRNPNWIKTRMILRKFLNYVLDNEPRETHRLGYVILTKH